METLNKNGVSITQTSGEEKYVKCCLGAFSGKSSVSCPLKPSDSAPLKHSTMPP